MVAERLRLDGRVALITGAGRGVGKAIAKTFAEFGASIVGMARTESEVAQTVAEIESEGGNALAVVGDVTRRADNVRAVEAAITRFGRLDILVNNAGGTSFGPFLDLSDEAFQDDLALNAGSAFMLSQLVVPHMLAAGDGSIVNISSFAGHVGMRGLVSYCTGKGALDQFTRALAQEVAPKIRVNAIALGAVMTSMLQSMFDADPDSQTFLRERTPLRREADPEDIALAALYLCSQRCCATGSILQVDGGIQSSTIAFPLADL